MIHIGEILNGVYDEEVGWRPASGSIKPVHVANGLIRALCGSGYDTDRLNRFVVWWKAGKIPDDNRSFETLTRGADGEYFGEMVDSQREFERLRRYMHGLLAADRAVFPSAEQSSYTLTTPQMTTRDPNDRGLGGFAAALLDDGTDQCLATVLKRVLSEGVPSDPLTTLAWPLLDNTTITKQGVTKPPRAWKARHNRESVRALRQAAECLATHESVQGNRLLTLQRAVHFACVATHVHAQALAANGDLAKRPPLLLATSGPRRSDIAAASERSLDGVYGGFERWLGDRLGAMLRERRPLADGETPIEVKSTDGRTIRSILGRVGVARKPHDAPDAEDINLRYQHYTACLKSRPDDDAPAVLGHALVACYLKEYESGGPRPFLQGLGRRCGLLYPHYAGRVREKRLRPSVQVLDMLVRSCVPAGRGLALEAFLSLLWERFGVLVGGRRSDDWDDAEALSAAGIHVDVQTLSSNTDQFVNALALMGLARRFPDGVTFVGDAYGA